MHMSEEVFEAISIREGADPEAHIFTDDCPGLKAFVRRPPQTHEEEKSRLSRSRDSQTFTQIQRLWSLLPQA